MVTASYSSILEKKAKKREMAIIMFLVAINWTCI